MDIEEFQKKNKPIGRRSRLEPFREGILELKNNGYANFQIAEWLALNGINVSQQTVRQFIKTQKEEKEKEKNQKNEREKTKNRESYYQTINNKKDAKKTEKSLEIDSQ